MATPQITAKRLSPFYHKQTALDARFVQDSFGWARVEAFTDSLEEKASAEQGVGIADLSHLTKLSLNGKGLMQFVSQRYSTARNETLGRVLIDGRGPFKGGMCALFSKDEALVILDESQKEEAVREVSSNKPDHFTIVDVSSTYAGVCVVGMNSARLLRRLTEFNVNEENFPNLSATYTPIRHVPTAIVRKDLGVLPGYQLYFERAYAEYVWDALFTAGKGLGVTALGAAAITLLETN